MYLDYWTLFIAVSQPMKSYGVSRQLIGWPTTCACVCGDYARLTTTEPNRQSVYVPAGRQIVRSSVHSDVDRLSLSVTDDDGYRPAGRSVNR